MTSIVLQHFITADYNHDQILLLLTDVLYNTKEKQKQRTIKKQHPSGHIKCSTQIWQILLYFVKYYWVMRHAVQRCGREQI